MKSPVITISILAFYLTCNSQTGSNRVRLIKWSSEVCDNTFDPYRLKTRISSIEDTDTSTIFIAHFSDNCCVTFKPAIDFYKNKLVLLPYRKYKGDYCGCDCCFSIRYEITGLTGKKYTLYFNESKVTLTDNYYDTVKPSYEVYNGENINRLNKYGFKEGTWMQFYENGVKVISQYAEQSLFYDSSPLWSKVYYTSGALSLFERKDSTESWFEDGELESQFFKYNVGDTTFKKGFRKFENRLLQKEYLEKSYPIIFKSDFDTAYQEKGSITEIVYKREYFQNGKPKFLFGSDTSFSWFETGQVELKRYKNGKIQFDSNGVLMERSFSWIEKGPKQWRNLDNTLDVEFYPNGNIRKIEFIRDEPTRDGVGLGVRYSWIWNDKMNLIEFPKGWKEPFPWTRFPELRLKPQMLMGIEKASNSQKNSH